MAPRVMPHARERFAGLLLGSRGRSRLTQRALATRAGVSLRAVQNWEAGLNYPTAERLRSLMGVLLEAGGLSPGSERDEAESMWSAAERESAYMHAPFDAAWFEDLFARRSNQTPLARTRERR